MSWFADTALDGIVGGVIGGGATGFAVWWTLRQERRRYDRQRADEEALRLISESRRLRPERHGEIVPTMAIFDWWLDVEMFAGAMEREHPTLARLLTSCTEKVKEASKIRLYETAPDEWGSEHVDTDGLANALISASRILRKSVRQPKWFAKLPADEIERLERGIRERGSVGKDL